jgi:hypothetical protein
LSILIRNGQTFFVDGAQMIDPKSSELPVAESRVGEPKKNPWFMLILALLASVAGSVIVGQVGNIAKMPPDFADMPLSPSPEYLARYNAALSAFRSQNYAIQISILGGLLGLAIGIAGASTNRFASAAAASIGGAAAALAGGFLLGLSAAYCVQINNGESMNLMGVNVEPIVQTTALQCFVWAVTGIGIGVGWTLANWGPKRILKGIEGGLVGGLLAGIVYTVVAATAFSGSSAFSFIPEQYLERIVWSAVCGTSVCLGLIYSVRNHSKKE